MVLALPKSLTVSMGFAALLVLATNIANAQATSRTCTGSSGEAPGPACLMASQALGPLPQGPLYWSIYAFDDAATAEGARPANGTVVHAFGKIWLFTIGHTGLDLLGGRRIADIGPLPVEPETGNFSAEYLKSTFSPGMSAPVHVHSGPEAFYAISGGTCLETPEGVQVARGNGHSLMVRRGPPMHLVAIGKGIRQGFAMILHTDARPPTTLTSDWSPKSLCPSD